MLNISKHTTIFWYKNIHAENPQNIKNIPIKFEAQIRSVATIIIKRNSKIKIMRCPLRLILESLRILSLGNIFRIFIEKTEYQTWDKTFFLQLQVCNVPVKICASRGVRTKPHYFICWLRLRIPKEIHAFFVRSFFPDTHFCLTNRGPTLWNWKKKENVDCNIRWIEDYEIPGKICFCLYL